MFSRNRIAFGLALLLTLIPSVAVLAKGGFSFITIIGPNLKDAVRVSDPALTSDFFAFANFYQDKIEAPANPGEGYEITRYYVDGKREVAFDRLHYYPETGFVYYDGIVNGSSEYDGEWYKANPKIKPAFETALSLQIKSGTSDSQPQAVKSIYQTERSTSAPQIQFITVIAITAGLAGLLGLAFWFRKPSTQ